MRARLLILSVAAAISFGTPALADKLIYRIDSATAVVVKRHLVISANGAVKSGGWDRPRLLVIEPSVSEASTLVAQFVARPPASSEVVVQALLPVTVRKIAKLPSYGTKQIRIIAETNTLVVRITR